MPYFFGTTTNRVGNLKNAKHSETPLGVTLSIRGSTQTIIVIFQIVNCLTIWILQVATATFPLVG